MGLVISGYSGVPQGTLLGPLLVNLYVNSMQNAIQKSCELVQYADDTFRFVSNECPNTAISQLEANAAHLVDYFKRHRLNLNENKTEFIVFSKRSNIISTKNLTFNLDRWYLQNFDSCREQYQEKLLQIVHTKLKFHQTKYNSLWNTNH